ncbi:hypothetical protein [Stutzerimonas nitrititolerans]|nr:hypothetical protein [Stutzerimonas nitrititolerans]
MTCDFLSQLLGAVALLPGGPQGEINFFPSGGCSYLENPTSDLLAPFMGGTAQVPCWLSKALLYCLAGHGLMETSCRSAESCNASER